MMVQTKNPLISIKALCKVFQSEKEKQVTALENIDLDVRTNEFVCVVGPSGCGKSTLLRVIAGLDRPTSGRAVFDGIPIIGTERRRGMVFQEYSLMPWRNVEKNIWMGPELHGKSRKECAAIAEQYIRLVKLEEFSKEKPHELSGGMRQRVAIARALANDPDVLLMDEHFGVLDSHTRIILQRELLNIWEAHKKTIIFVTHSVDEAVFLADRIIVMSARPGRIILEEPVNLPRPRKRDNPVYANTVESILELLEN